MHWLLWILALMFGSALMFVALFVAYLTLLFNHYAGPPKGYIMRGWRTLAVMIAVAVAGILQQADWATLVPPQYVGLALSAVGGLGTLLRIMTTTPVGGNK